MVATRGAVATSAAAEQPQTVSELMAEGARPRWPSARWIQRLLTGVAALLLTALIAVGCGRLSAVPTSAPAMATPVAARAESASPALVSTIAAPHDSDSTGMLASLDRATRRETLPLPTAETRGALPSAPSPMPTVAPTPSRSTTPTSAGRSAVPTPTPGQAPTAPHVNPKGPRELKTVKISVPSRPHLSEQIGAATFLDADHGWLVMLSESVDLKYETALYASADGGRTWTKRSELSTFSPSLDFVSTSTGWATSETGLLATTDGGATWRSVALPGKQRSVARLDFVDATHGWITGEPSREGSKKGEPPAAPVGASKTPLLRTADGGRTWVTLATPCDDRFVLVGFSFVSSRSGWLLCNGESEGRTLYHTDNSGSTWRLISESKSHGADPAASRSLPDGGYHDVSLYFLDDLHGWLASSQDGLFRTADGGRTWTPTSLGGRGSSALTVRFFTPERGYVVERLPGLSGTETLIMETRDAGLTWTQVYPELAPAGSRVTFVDARHGFGFGDVWLHSFWNALLASDDGGATWHPVSVVGDGSEFVIAFSFADLRNGWVVTGGQDAAFRPCHSLYHTSDGGKTWTKLPADVDKLLDAADGAYPGHISFVDDQTGYVGIEDIPNPAVTDEAGTSHGHLAVTHDGGNSFTIVDPGDSPIDGLDFVTKDVGWKVSNYQIYATRDGGKSWSPVPLGYLVLDVQLISETRAWVVAEDATADGLHSLRVLLTDDGGQTWTRYDFGAIQVSPSFADDQHGWLKTSVGEILLTSDGGRTWAPVR